MLLHAFRVTYDHRVGRIDNRTRRTVVLFQFEDHRRGIILLERKDILDFGPAERVDRLRVVAHDADLRVRLRQAADNRILGIIGVLILVDEDVFELLLIAGQHVGAVAQQDVGLQQQIVEVHRAVTLAALAVDVVDVAELGNLRLPVLGGAGRIGQVGARRDEAVFGIGNARRQHVGLVLLVRKVQFADDRLQEVLAVAGFVDRERVGEPDLPGVLPQDTRKNRVERTHADITAAVVGQHLRNALAQLLGGLVGEGQRQNIPGLYALFDHVCYTRGQHAGLARPGARDDERRRVVIDHGIPLGGVQTL